MALASCANDERSPFDPSADRRPPALVDFTVTTAGQHVYATWQADEPVHAVVEYDAADGTVHHSYSGDRGFATSGVTKLLKLASHATYGDVRVRLRDRAGNEAIAQPAGGDTFATDVVADEELLFLAMIDVGWGDALYLQSPEGTRVLIDAGQPQHAPDVHRFLWDYLNVRSLDFVSMTHVHSDHIGGFYGDSFSGVNGLLSPLAQPQRIAVRTFIDLADKTPGTVSGSPYGSLAGAISGMLAAQPPQLERYVALHTGASSDNEPALRWGAELKVDLLAEGRKDFLIPDYALQSAIASVQNNDSMIYRVQFRDFVLLLMGDGEFATEEFLENRYSPEFLRADVLKLGHHGSNDANSERWLNFVDPTAALITNVVSENPGVEHPFVLGRLKHRGTDYYASDRVIPNRDRAESGVRGDVLLYSDGHAFTMVVDHIRYE